MAHPWIGQSVYDIANGQTGLLMAVVTEPAGFATGAPRIAKLAYVRNDKNVEWSTALGNLSLAGGAP
ncbi:hypothetical protein [Streptomyces goshikiensis]|uniref:hypothetical protein n=1 Tax=Streptomyces goshikiensis TaxID=1942 RepID=UPI0036C18DBB